MERTPICPYGFFNATLAQQTGVTRDDLARFWEAIACMFPNLASASKGLMASKDLVVFVHPNSRGIAPLHKLFEKTQLIESNKGKVLFEIEDEDKLETAGIEIYQPFRVMWLDL